MTEIYPFRALRYNPEKVGDLERVVTQPYDKITPGMQARYYSLSPYNLARIIRRRSEPGESPEALYAAAARDCRQWNENRVLVPEREPALYPYDQEYSVPGEPHSRKLRRGFIALLRLEDYAARVVHRHEETLSAPKADRLELLKATRAHFGQIFMLYSDAEGAVEAKLGEGARHEPWERVRDEFDSLHSVWRISDAKIIEQVAEAMREKKLVIADGHHRYETALAYRNACRAQAKHDDRAEYVMATFVRMETEGLTILPTHRVVHSLASFDWRRFEEGARHFFECEPARVEGTGREAATRFTQAVERAGREGPAIGAYGGPGRLALLRLRRDIDLAGLLPDQPASLRRLDVVLLHRLLLERVLAIDAQAVREEKKLRYVRESEEAMRQVESGAAQISFLLNSTPVEAVRDNAFAGLVLPQKSTDFYPKLLSGLTIYWLDHPGGM